MADQPTAWELKRATTTSEPAMRAVVALAAQGLRQAEVAQLTWKDVDLIRGSIRRRPRELTISDDIVRELRAGLASIGTGEHVQPGLRPGAV